MADTVLVAIHEVEFGPQNGRKLVKPGPFPRDVEIDIDTEAELVRAGAVKRVPVKRTEAVTTTEPAADEGETIFRPRKSNRFRKSF